MATGDKIKAVMTTDIDNGSSTYPVLSPSGDGSDVTAAFTAAASRTNISTGEKLSVICGKIAKWFTDLGDAAFRGVDSTVTASSTNLVESGAVKSALTHDLANIVATGSTNTTGATIVSGTYFYLNGTLVRAKANIAVNATFTSGTNYEAVTAGGLNELNAALAKPNYSITFNTNSIDTGYAGTNYTLFSCNGICHLNITLLKFNLASLPNTSWTNIGTVPSAVRPSKNASGTCAVISESVPVCILRANVQTDGGILIRPQTTISNPESMTGLVIDYPV